MKALPNLTAFGLGGELRWRNPGKARSYRAEMLTPRCIDQFTLGCAFLNEIEPRKKINPQNGSATIKHIAEGWAKAVSLDIPAYCSNGMFITAAIHSGFTVTPIYEGSEYAYLNYSTRSLDRLLIKHARDPHIRPWCPGFQRRGVARHGS